jgi:hypothetical protein
MIINSAGGKFQYTILSAQREPLPPDRYLLKLRVRAWTDWAAGMNFWDDSFRLVAGNRILAPVKPLNEMVDRDATVDGDVQFEIDNSLTDAILKISYGDPNSTESTKQLRLIFP